MGSFRLHMHVHTMLSEGCGVSGLEFSVLTNSRANVTPSTERPVLISRKPDCQLNMRAWLSHLEVTTQVDEIFKKDVGEGHGYHLEGE